MKKKYYSSLIAVALFIASVSTNIANTYRNESVQARENKSIKQTLNLKKLDGKTNNEVLLGEDITELPTKLNNKNKNVLNSYGVKSESVKKSTKIKDNKNKRIVTEVKFDNNSDVQFDESNNIVSITNFKEKNSTAQKIVNSTLDLQSIISNIETSNNLKNGYVLVTSQQFDDDYWELIWQKELGKNVLNPYDSVKVFVDRKDKTIATFNKFNMQPNITKPVITEEKALLEAQPVINTISNVKTKSVKLTAVKPNFYWDKSGPYEEADVVRLAYDISVNNGAYSIYIDAETGENIGGNMERSSDAKAFAYSGFTHAQASADMAYNGMRSLGYNSLSSLVASSSSLGSSIYNYWRSSTAYAFYVDCHGSPTSLGDNVSWSLSTSDVTGNWHFVFLDACSTGVDTGWANAFKINGYSRRAFLGWYDEVGEYAAYEFDTHFWPEVVNQSHSSNVRDAAVYAAGQSASSTPIRFYGDRSYNGRAY